MTYTVPYAFVPGTKAKADEVNANFIDILEKIKSTDDYNKETEKRITEAEKNITDITNKLDGEWTKVNFTICNQISLQGTSNATFNVSILPDDGNIYEILIEAYANTVEKSWYIVYVTTSVISTSRILSADSNNSANGKFDKMALVSIPIGANRQITINRSSSMNGLLNLIIKGYRKVQ